MRLLLDTHLLLWSLFKSPRLGAAVRDILEAGDTAVFFSAVSIWEIAIKAGLSRADFAVEPDAVMRAALEVGMTELPVHSRAATQVRFLPHYHRDPFDRLLVAQAIAGDLRLYTADRKLGAYSDLVVLVD